MAESASEKKEPEILEIGSKFRYTFLPVEFKDIHEHYKKAQESQWTPEDIKEELGMDRKGWTSWEPEPQQFIKTVIAFFSISDGVVVETLGDELQSRIQVREVKVCYNHQAMMEDVHSEVYSKLAEEYVSSREERNTVFEAVKSMPSITRKIDWIHKWVGHGNPFRRIPRDQITLLRRVVGMVQKTAADFLDLIDYDGIDLENPASPVPRLDSLLSSILDDDVVPLGQIIMANAIMEGVFFSASFAAIFWVNHYYKGLLPGLAKANEWISRDEGWHTDFAILLYRKYIRNKLSIAQVHAMFKEAIDVETAFVETALPVRLKGMNVDLMSQYVRFVADSLLSDLGYPKLFNAQNPFDWMTKQSVSVRIPDFFVDQNVSEYRLGNDNGLRFDENF